MKSQCKIALKQLLPAIAALGVGWSGGAAFASVPGITGATGAPVFNLTASADYISQPDGMTIYSFGYGCAQSSTPGFAPYGGTCPLMQMPGPTMIVNEGDAVTVNLSDNLPAAAGNTSILFPGFTVAASGGVPGLLAQEASSQTPVSYTFTANKPGTYSYYSGSRPDLQIEMGMFGALIVLPKTTQTGCVAVGTETDPAHDKDYRLAASAYDNPNTCFDREYLFQFSELSAKVHQQVESQVLANATVLTIKIEPYHPEYFMVNGRSMPDDMDANYAGAYPHQPYNGNPHMHPGDLVLMRVIGQGHWQHPFHHHGNHARVLARDGNLITSQSDPTNSALAGPLVFTVPTVPGQTVDAVFTWTGQGLNWDVYGPITGPTAHTCSPLAGSNLDQYTKEYCPDHGKAMPVAPPDHNIVANGLWYGGSPYLGIKVATLLPPGTDSQNITGSYAYMWHSHNEREITTNDIFPGGMMMMLLIDPPATPIDESK